MMVQMVVTSIIALLFFSCKSNVGYFNKKNAAIKWNLIAEKELDFSYNQYSVKYTKICTEIIDFKFDYNLKLNNIRAYRYNECLNYLLTSLNKRSNSYDSIVVVNKFYHPWESNDNYNSVGSYYFFKNGQIMKLYYVYDDLEFISQNEEIDSTTCILSYKSSFAKRDGCDSGLLIISRIQGSDLKIVKMAINSEELMKLN
ncbi:MAG: hypothetical protein IPK46_09045 [Saprospiraceae bacterium]|nr:hypothetical protein [Saprospiraceae bacterium]